MAKANQFGEMYIPSYYAPWWKDISVSGYNVVVTVENPDISATVIPHIQKTLTPAMIHEAFAARFEFLCCGQAMKEDGYEWGCAEDADQVLQQATFGETVYS